MSIQFDTFDTLEDRRELVILFQRLGEGTADPNLVRARWLERLILTSVKGFKGQVNPDSCSPIGAYNLFVQIVGVLGVSIRDAAVALDRSVSEARNSNNCRR